MIGTESVVKKIEKFKVLKKCKSSSDHTEEKTGNLSIFGLFQKY